MGIKKQIEGVLVRKCIGVNVQINEQSIEYCAVQLLIKSNKDFEIIKTVQGFENVLQLVNISKSIPLCLSIYSDTLVMGDTASDILPEDVEKILGGEVGFDQMHDFVFLHRANEYAYARKSYIIELFGDIIADQIRIAQISLNKFYEYNAAELITQFLGKEQISVGNYLFISDSNKLNCYVNKTKGDLIIGDIAIAEEYIPAFCAALSYLYPVDDARGLVDFNSNRKQFYYRLLFDKSRIPLLIFVFISFLISTLCFLYYNGVNEGLAEKSRILEQLDKKHADLNAYITNHGSVLKESNRTLEYSVFCDQFANTIPEHIQLNRLTISPVVSLSGKKVGFQHDLVVVEGMVSDPAVFSKWFEILQHQKWVHSLNEPKYWLDVNGNGHYKFTLKRNVE